VVKVNSQWVCFSASVAMTASGSRPLLIAEVPVGSLLDAKDPLGPLRVAVPRLDLI